MSDIYQQLGIVRWVQRNAAPVSADSISDITSVSVGSHKVTIVMMPPGDDTPESAQLLTAMLKSISLTRDDVQIIDVAQMNASTGLLFAMGETAAQALLGTQASLESLRGKIHAYGEQLLIVTYHPTHLLRNPKDKRNAYADLLLVKSHLDHTAC